MAVVRGGRAGKVVRVYREALRPIPSRQDARAAKPKILEEERGQAVNPKGCFHGRRWRQTQLGHLGGPGLTDGFLTENQNLGFRGGDRQARPEARAM